MPTNATLLTYHPCSIFCSPFVYLIQVVDLSTISKVFTFQVFLFHSISFLSATIIRSKGTPVVRIRVRGNVVRVQARHTEVGTVVRTTHASRDD